MKYQVTCNCSLMFSNYFLNQAVYQNIVQAFLILFLVFLRAFNKVNYCTTLIMKNMKKNFKYFYDNKGCLTIFY